MSKIKHRSDFSSEEEYDNWVSNKIYDSQQKALEDQNKIYTPSSENSSSPSMGCAWLLAIPAYLLLGMFLLSTIPSPITAIFLCVGGIILLVGIMNN